MDIVARGSICFLVILGMAGCSGDDPLDPTIAVIDTDFPDPDVLRVGDTYFAYATNDATTNVRVATSTDLMNWELLADDALPQLPTWVIPGKTWAPRSRPDPMAAT